MTEQERAQLIADLEATAKYTLDPNVEDLARVAAARIRVDGHRLKAQSEMAVTLNNTMEQALAALATFKKQCRCRS